jgi:hypothetical protein
LIELAFEVIESAGHFRLEGVDAAIHVPLERVDAAVDLLDGGG